MADKGYDADERVIQRLQWVGIKAVIQPKRNRWEPREHDRELYQARHLIANVFACLKQYRAIATPYDQRAGSFSGAIYLAAAVAWVN